MYFALYFMRVVPKLSMENMKFLKNVNIQRRASGAELEKTSIIAQYNDI